MSGHYKVLTAPDILQIEETVEEWMIDGWCPCGGIFVLTMQYTDERKGHAEIYHIYHQAMTREFDA